MPLFGGRSVSKSDFYASTMKWCKDPVCVCVCVIPESAGLAHNFILHVGISELFSESDHHDNLIYDMQEQCSLLGR